MGYKTVAFDGSVIMRLTKIVPTSTVGGPTVSLKGVVVIDGINDEVKIDMALTESVSVSLWFAYPSNAEFSLQPNYSAWETCSNGLGITAGLHKHKISD